ncbi:cytochrome c biogenesis CcdA family protein [Allokutzneria sp. A3M-2-11 16]|uniref:cytochrome c biogenesis CcdA family protein n=1 Tax=Allokutzneria sp. A3M-2-11 16 TaxID=2962043 RepID=UPI0020B8E775|nr:cytochrome c biogenesis CcdA family protein [Allokutzneria sp. A3M-2-11 16]MCP3801122.1 cytochrome c biogenesis CcdA family protein [Allokutzneria sp. A3M-2-11 16]
MTVEVGYLGALLGGVLALASPCSALLLPAFFAYAFENPKRLLARTAVFYCGLITTLVPLGVASAALGALFTEHRATVTLISGIVLIVLGVAQILGKGFGSRRAQEAAARITVGSAASVFALGAVYGLAGFCSGPILGAVLTVAAAGGDPAYGGVLLAVYGLGMVLPLFALALLWERLKLGQRAWLRGREVTLGPLRVHSTTLVSGLLFIGIGLLFVFTEGTAGLSGLIDVDTEFSIELWVRGLAESVPDLAVIGAAAVLLAVVFAVRRRRSAR